MKVIRLLLAGIIFIISCPLSWVGAWIAGSWFTFGLSLVMPTYGAIYWLLLNVMGHGFIHSILSWILGFGGAFITLGLINILCKDL